MIKYNIFNSDSDIIVGENFFYTFKDAAKIINHKDLGQKNLFKLLREKEILGRYNEPLGDWEKSGFFKVVNNRYGTTLISTHGINYIQKHFI